MAKFYKFNSGRAAYDSLEARRGTLVYVNFALELSAGALKELRLLLPVILYNL